MKQIAKRDTNEREIIDALRKAGCTVQQLNDPNVPDLLVGLTDAYSIQRNYLLEVKYEKGKLKKGQEEWHENWKGQVTVVRTVEEALDVIRPFYTP